MTVIPLGRFSSQIFCTSFPLPKRKHVNLLPEPFLRYYDLEKWEAKRQKKSELKALKKAKEKALFSIADDEKRHELLHRRVDPKKYGIVYLHFFLNTKNINIS